MLMYNSSRYVRLCLSPTILILFKVSSICFLNLFVLNFLMFLNKLCIYESNGLQSGATSISDGIFFYHISPADPAAKGVSADLAVVEEH